MRVTAAQWLLVAGVDGWSALGCPVRMASAIAKSRIAPASNNNLLGSASLPCRMINRVIPVMAI